VTLVIEHGAAPAPLTTEMSEVASPVTASLKLISNEGVKLLVGVTVVAHVAVGADPSIVNTADVTAVDGPLFKEASLTLPASKVGITVPSVEHVYVVV
jgi:hypothetical protein